RNISGLEQEEFRISYHSSLRDAENREEEFLTQMAENREDDIRTGITSVGPHRDDLNLSLNKKNMKVFASQGQIRTAALSLKLAQMKVLRQVGGETPVLLLDDVLSELDQKRQEFVLNRIGGGQTLITCCEDEGISGKTGGKIFFVDQGRVRTC
ncbi:MAG: DNA replication and repair protein RecF, partial [Oscillospiraceae bacterium]|nr:DNA replication and repair protein RecF [Oscillospiraceae bacterium]